MSEVVDGTVTRGEKVRAVLEAARFKPRFTVFLIVLGLLVAMLEGVGLTFIIPIVEIVQADDPADNADGVMAMFLSVYDLIGLPFTLGFVILGVSAIMTLRFTSDFLYSWLRRVLRYEYQRDLQQRTFDGALYVQMEYYDTEGSDDILNAIITETAAAARVINMMIRLLNLVFLTSVYLLIALWISPLLTVFAVVALGGITAGLRHVVNPGYTLGDRVADANEQRHRSAQAGVIGIRDVRLFNLQGEVYQRFVDAVDQFTRNSVKLKRNEAALNKFYNLAVAVFVFVLIYVALGFADLSFGELGLFLFVMFQLGPKMSNVNELFYAIENNLPHLVRSHRFLQELDARRAQTEGSRPSPQTIESLEFADVSFAYDDERILDGINFTVQRGEFIGFVGQSGAGKSTIVSLLTRLYEPDQGRILANEVPIDEMNPDEWRAKLGVVRQSPFIFNESLRYNLTIGNRHATHADIELACEIAKVDEFLDDLPDGFDSTLGDDGVQLSGGQKQRVALARALLRDADILILDEATSNLDSNLERDVQLAIERMDRDYAIVAIAHRLSTVENADRIYTLKDGRISEEGIHEELVDQGGTYAQMYAIQSG